MECCPSGRFPESVSTHHFTGSASYPTTLKRAACNSYGLAVEWVNYTRLANAITYEERGGQGVERQSSLLLLDLLRTPEAPPHPSVPPHPCQWWLECLNMPTHSFLPVKYLVYINIFRIPLPGYQLHDHYITITPPKNPNPFGFGNGSVMVNDSNRSLTTITQLTFYIPFTN